MLKRLAVLLFMAPAVAICAQQYTRGLGVYPGDPSQYDGPSLVVDSTTYRNLALHRPAYQSSAYDYNLTAPLVTDGIKESVMPQWIATSTSDRGLLPKNEREMFLDGNPVSAIEIAGQHPWVQVDIEGPEASPEIDRVDVWLRKIDAPPPTGGWNIAISGSNDKVAWSAIGRFDGTEFPSMKDSDPAFKETIRFLSPVRFRSYRVEFSAAGVQTWNVGDLSFFDRDKEVHLAGPQTFFSDG